jgi:3-deoxy-D-manno-octulosonic-acid transferase
VNNFIPIAFRIYGHIINATIPLWRAVGFWRQQKAKEDGDRFKERVGVASAQRPQGSLVWFHGAGIGETRAALAIIDNLKKLYPHITILLTSQTRSAINALIKDLPDYIIHQYAPYDVPVYVNRFLDHWKPQAFCVVEAEFWPVTWASLNSRKIPMFLCNFHISEKSLQRWQRIPSFFQYFYGFFQKRWGGCSSSYERFKKIAPNLSIQLMPSLKYASPLLKEPTQKFSTLKHPFWFASCVHSPEEELIFSTHRTLRQEIPNLVLFYSPRHMDRVPFLEERAKKESWNIQKRTDSKDLKEDTDIYIIDTFGELGLFYSSFPFTVLCGSFSSGGHNVIEPLSLGCAVISGPDMKNNQDIANDFFEKGGAVQVSEETLVPQILHWIRTPQEAQKYALTALELLKSSRHKVTEIVQEIANDIETGITNSL